MKIFLVVFLFALSSFALLMGAEDAFAQAPTDSEIVVGSYFNDEFGVGVTFPDGINAFLTEIDNPHTGKIVNIQMHPTDSDAINGVCCPSVDTSEVTILLDSHPLTMLTTPVPLTGDIYAALQGYNMNVKMDNLGDIQVLTSTVDIEREYPPDYPEPIKRIGKFYFVNIGDQRYLSYGILASEENYKKYIDIFENSAKTLSVANAKPIDLGAIFFNPIQNEIKLKDGSMISADVMSPSVINSVTLQDDSKTFHINITEPNSFRSFLVMDVGDVLDGPYTATFDENSVDVQILENESVRYLLLFYSGEGIHDIAITGTSIQYDSASVMQENRPINPNSPLQQIKAGIIPKNVICKPELTLMIRPLGDAACVRPDSVYELTQKQGWIVVNTDADDTEFKDTEHDTREISLPVYPSFDNGVTEIINPDHESLRYRNTIQIIDDTYLSKYVQQWSDASPDELQAEPEKYDGDEFYTELGRLLMKNEMQYQMNELGIVNVQDDFEVISGMSLDSLPPHISFSSIIHATDGHYYWLQGGTHANQANYYKTTQLQYPNPTETGFDSSRVSPDVIPQVSIVQKAGDGENDLKSVPPFTVLHQPGDVEFYNDATGALTVYLTKDGLEEFSFENSQKIVIQSESDAVWSFADPGSYSWRGDVPIMIGGNKYDLHTGGSILVLSDDMSDLSKEEKIETVRTMLVTSSLPITGIGQQGEEDTLFINLSPAISELLPESNQYYLEAAQKLIPFEDISITLDE